MMFLLIFVCHAFNEIILFNSLGTWASLIYDESHIKSHGKILSHCSRKKSNSRKALMYPVIHQDVLII